MDANKEVDRKPLVYLVIAVCLAGGLVAWFFGSLAELGYYLPYMLDVAQSGPNIPLIGGGWGAVTGLLAGAIWCWWMIPRAIHFPDEDMSKKGANAGMAVGVLSTILLHAGLMIVWSRVDLGILAIGLLCGVVAGLVVGIICGKLCRFAVNRAFPVDARIDDQKASE